MQPPLQADIDLRYAHRVAVGREVPIATVDAQTLAECDRLALERFQMLDAMEAEDEKNPAR